MKYWPFYGERWITKTSHLTMMQDGAYHRLIIWCLSHERPLPLNRKDCYRIARTENRHQEFAVDFVIDEFFVAGPDGYHQNTVDETLTWWEAEGKARHANQVIRLRARGASFRTRQRLLVTELRGMGINVPYRLGMTELLKLASEHGISVTGNAGNAVANGGANGVTNKPEANVASLREATGDRPGPFTLALRAAEGTELPGVTADNGDFVALVTRGALPPLFAAVCCEAKVRGKSFPWAMAAALGRLRDGVIDLKGDAVATPRNGRASADQGHGNALVPPEAREALRKRFHDPAVRDPWELPELAEEVTPSPSESDGTL